MPNLDGTGPIGCCGRGRGSNCRGSGQKGTCGRGGRLGQGAGCCQSFATKEEEIAFLEQRSDSLNGRISALKSEK